MTDKNNKKTSLTVLLPAGQLPKNILAKVNALADIYSFELYLSTMQNLRIFNVAEEDAAAIKDELAKAGAQFKAPGKFPVPRVCIGNQSCNLGIVDTVEVSAKILEHFNTAGPVKPKFKIAVSGCPAMCSGAALTDIGIVATRSGFDIYAGGKGGPRPNIGIRIAKGVDTVKMLDIISELVRFHDAKTEKKQRMSKLLKDADFPFREAV